MSYQGRRWEWPLGREVWVVERVRTWWVESPAPLRKCLDRRVMLCVYNSKSNTRS